MTPARKIELRAKVTEIIAQEARHLADSADYDQVAKDDEEDEFLRAELHRQADDLARLALPPMVHVLWAASPFVIDWTNRPITLARPLAYGRQGRPGSASRRFPRFHPRR